MSVPTVIQSNLVPFAISTDDITFYNIVCKKAWGYNSSVATSSEESDCGIHTGLGALSWTFDFEVILNSTPNGATEKSVKDLLAYQVAQTLLYVLVKYPSSTGADLYLKGTAYITNFAIRDNVGNLITCTGTLTGASAIDITP